MKIKDSHDKVYTVNIPDSGNGEYYMVCPICTPARKQEHRNEKKLAVNLSKDPHPWRCNHCGEGGYLYNDEDYIRSRIKPVLSLPRFRVPTETHYAWLSKRGIERETAMAFNISISNEMVMQRRNPDPKKINQSIKAVCLNFPYYMDGVLINVKYRDANKNFKLIAKASKIFYNIDSIKNSKYCIIVEGEFDAMAYHQAGHTAVVSVPNGATISKAEKEHFETTGTLKIFNPLNLEYLDLNIERFDHLQQIYIATDDDAPGIKLRQELARRLGKERCKFIRFGDYKDDENNPINDPNQLLMVRGEKVLADTINHSYDFPIENVSTANEHMDELIRVFDHGRERGKSSGYHTLDHHFSWFPGWLYLLNGYPNEGKTTWWMNMMAISSMLYGDKWGIYSPENYPIINMIDTFAEILLDNTANPEIKGRINKYQYKEVIEEHIDRHFFFVNNDDGYTPDALRDVKIELIKKKGITGFFTDPWSSLDHPRMVDIREDQYIAQELNKEVRIATKYSLVNVISHHPPKPPDPKGNLKPPHPYQMSGGSQWWNKAYVIICVHRINRTDYDDTKVGIHIQKVKEEKIFGFKTNPEKPVILEYKKRSNRFLERIDPKDPNSKYSRYPVKKWETNKQLSFDEFM